jgi:fumarate reductase subunit C
MAGSAHPDAMGPPKPGRTRTAPPEMPKTWWTAPRIRTYLLFDATGFFYFVLGFLAIDLIWALGEGPDVWNARIESLTHPVYIAFHALAFAAVIFVGIRFFSLFPKAQPRDTGLPMPPDNVIKGLLYVLWIGITVGLSAVLSGVIF